MKNFLTHTRNYIFRGLLAIIPILLCVFALQLLYVLIDKRVMGFLDNFIEIRYFPGLGVLLVLFCLYFLGLIVSNIIGHSLFRFIESISKRIPFINTIYAVGKQLSQGLSFAEGDKQAFKKAVLVKLNNGIMVPAFIMNYKSIPGTNEELVIVLIPTAPTPASGFVVMVKAAQIFDPGWTVEECLKAVVSVGIILPKDMKLETLIKEN